MLVLAVMAMTVVVMLAFPQTGMGRVLNRLLVEAPARALNRLQRGKVVAYLLLALVGIGLVLLFEAEGMRLFGFLLPDTLVWFAMFDVGVFVDALLITGAILATNGVRAIRAQVSAVPAQIQTILRRWTARARRAPGPSSPRIAETSDDDRPAWSGQPAYRAFSMA